MSSKFNLNPDYIDDYFVVGAEIFRNYFKAISLAKNMRAKR